MKLSAYLNKKKAQHLPVTVDGNDIDDVFFRRLSSGEGVQLKDAFADLLGLAGDAVKEIAGENAVEADKKARETMKPEQLRALSRFQATFVFLHLSDKDGARVFSDRKEFDREVSDEFVQAFYLAGSEHKAKTEPTEEQAEKNSSTPTA